MTFFIESSRPWLLRCMLVMYVRGNGSPRCRSLLSMRVWRTGQLYILEIWVGAQKDRRRREEREGGGRQQNNAQ